MNELLSLQDLFYKKIFRIPDYQRGYSWNTQQLKEFWNDLYNLLPNKDHYTGMISLKKLTAEETKNWDNENWLFTNASYKAYHIVDGQQRLTTFIILINEIIEFYKKINIGKDLDKVYINSVSLQRIIDDYLYIVDPESENIIKTYKFGYEVDNPSYEFFKHRILGEQNEGEIKETFYTLNLENAKIFFKERIEELANDERLGLKAIENIFKKLTQKMKFNMYYIDNDFNVFIAFETMNNRGKPLSYLELLKNRLIYLSTLFEVHESKRNIIRKEINETWKTVYSYLGRNKDKPLDDNEFLQNHWMIYFKYTRSNKVTYDSFLLNDYFTQQNIFNNDIIKIMNAQTNFFDIENTEISEIENDDIIESQEDDINTNKKSNKNNLSIGNVNDYILSLKNLVTYWYQIHFPSVIENEKIKLYLERLNRIGFVNFKPLATVILSKKNISDEQKSEALRGMERFVFLHYRLNGYVGTYKNSFFYGLAHKLYFNEITIDEVIKELNTIDYMDNNNVINTSGVLNKFNRMFNGSNKGFYSWASLRYLLYEYERHLMFGKGAIRLLPSDIFKADKKDTCSIEHIYPQTPTDKDWLEKYEKFDDKQKYRLTGSLGNLLPLSKSINSSLQNDKFTDKKNGVNRYDLDGIPRGYINGSYNEIEVSSNDVWTSEKILERGIKIVNFMQNEWDFLFPSRADKIKFLGLDFMIKEDDYNIDLNIFENQERNVVKEIYPDVEEPLYLIVDNIKYATGYYKNGGILVKAGSKIRQNVLAARESMQQKIDRERKNPNIINGVYISDVFYDSPSLAANVILGNHKNGWDAWKNDAKVTLDKIVGRKFE